MRALSERGLCAEPCAERMCAWCNLCMALLRVVARGGNPRRRNHAGKKHTLLAPGQKMLAVPREARSAHGGPTRGVALDLVSRRVVMQRYRNWTCGPRVYGWGGRVAAGKGGGVPVSNSTDDRLTATAAARLEPDPAAGTPETRPPSSPPPNTRALFLLAQAYPLAPPPQ